MPKWQAESRLAAILQPINAKLSAPRQFLYTFGEYVECVYVPFCRRTWKGSTDQTSWQSIKTHLLPALGDKLLSQIGREEMQELLEQKAELRSKSLVSHLRWFLKAIFKLAVSDGYLSNNPAAELRIPKGCRPGRDLRAMTTQEVITYLEALDLREQLIASLAIWEGLSPGESLGLRWNSFREGSISVSERVYRGVFDSPKNGKPRRVALGPATADLLEQWKPAVVDPAGASFVFASEKGSTPLSRDNLWRRHMEPKLKKVGMGWATFQVLRKTNASLGNEAGVNPKVAADQRGHGIGVSLNVYTRSSLEQQREAIEKVMEYVKSKTPKKPIQRVA